MTLPLKKKTVELPRYLYKFRYFDKEGRHLKILSDKELFFASPDSFNDPFDCQAPVRSTAGSRDQIISRFVRIHKISYPYLTTAQPYEFATDSYQKKTFMSPERIEMLNKQKQDFISRSVGFFCMSSNYRTILSWSHYSDSHRGFCVGIEVKMLAKLCAAYNDTHGPPMGLMPVKYDNLFPMIDPFVDSDQAKLQKQFFTKSKEWEYEREYRVMLAEGANTFVKVENLELRRLILGCQIRPENRNLIISILKEKHPNTLLFQAEMKEEEYGLRFQRLSY